MWAPRGAKLTARPVGWMCVCAMGPRCPEGQRFVPAQDEEGNAGHWSPGWCVGSASQLITPALSRKMPEAGCRSSGHDHEARTWHLCQLHLQHFGLGREGSGGSPRKRGVRQKGGVTGTC